jgi:hypothetical protein
MTKSSVLVSCLSPAPAARAPSIFEREVRPALEAAGCRLTMQLTKAAGHATGEAETAQGKLALGSCAQESPTLNLSAALQHIPSCYTLVAVPSCSCCACYPYVVGAAEVTRQLAPGAVDGVIAIGGDGTMYEALQASCSWVRSPTRTELFQLVQPALQPPC